MLYDKSYTENLQKDFEKISNLDTLIEDSGLAIEVEDDFADPPALVTCRWIQNMDGPDALDYIDQLVRYAVNKRKITIHLGGQPVPDGAFIRNNVNDSWDVIPIMAKLPAAYMLLSQTVVGWMSKKFLLPLQTAVVAAAAQKQPKLSPSSEK